ncbi:hypothetical protein [Flocculibacter collagenilyticus]|uniref:hypothetical protein n=1 Tax=Flocculibacter collagenilyticus TaxID=2744479 RepID=UPI0018F6B168|nr:hypothetical protein [Flocculibacter collagenilyticus]
MQYGRQFFLLSVIVTINGVWSLSVYAEENKTLFTISPVWHSHYVSEGRDNLPDSRFQSLHALGKWNDLAAGVWYGNGMGNPYREVNVYLEHGFSYSSFEGYIGYNHIKLHDTDESDNEIYAGLTVSPTSSINLALDYTYSTEADGGFAELRVDTEKVLADGQVLITPYIAEGFDFGYASESYDGVNNLKAGVEMVFKVNPNVEFIGSINHSKAHKDVEREEHDDQSWITFGLSLSF